MLVAFQKLYLHHVCDKARVYSGSMQKYLPVHMKYCRYDTIKHGGQEMCYAGYFKGRAKGRPKITRHSDKI